MAKSFTLLSRWIPSCYCTMISPSWIRTYPYLHAGACIIWLTETYNKTLPEHAALNFFRVDKSLNTLDIDICKRHGRHCATRSAVVVDFGIWTRTENISQKNLIVTSSVILATSSVILAHFPFLDIALGNIVHQNAFYSGDLISDHLKSGNIWNTEFLKVGFQTVWLSNG